MRREFQAAVGGGVGMDGSHPTMGGGKAVFTSTWNETRGSRIIFMMSAFGGCGRGRYRWPIPIRDEKVRHMTTRKHNIDLASKLISYESKTNSGTAVLCDPNFFDSTSDLDAEK